MCFRYKSPFYGMDSPPPMHRRFSQYPCQCIKSSEQIACDRKRHDFLPAFISRLLELTKGRVRIFVGNAGFQMIEGLDRGAVGVMPGCSMFDICIAIYKAWQAGIRAEAFRLHNELLAMLDHMRQNVEEIIFYEKRILARRGAIRHDYCRKPSLAPDAHFDRLFDEQFEKIKPLLAPL